MNFEKYIGIPYAEKGRDETGADCWGLIRLIYKNELSIDLPSFSAEYDTSDNERLEELFAQYKEGWEPVDSPAIGDVVIFKIFGYESHIGFCIGNNQFLHIREGRDSVIESLDNAKWSKRIVGFFKYSEKSNAILNTIPHPLRTQLYTINIVPGTTVTELVKNINQQYDVAAELKSRISVIINGRVIAQEQWSSTIINNSDVIEYRAVAGKEVLKVVALIALVYFAPMIALEMLGTTAGAYTATAIGQGLFLAAAQVGVMLVGSALINAIAPIRPPVQAQRNDPGSAERQLMVNGGSNRMNPYGAIPVVLGKVRMTPLLGSNNFLTYENERDSYLSMLLVWGYGPLNIDDNSYKIGEVPLNNYDPANINKITLDRKTEPTESEKRNFDAIYGKDIVQVNTAIELTCDGNPEIDVPPGPWFEAATSSQVNPATGLTDPVNSVTIALHFPQGLRIVKLKGQNAGDSLATFVNFEVQYSYDLGVSWNPLELSTIGGDSPKKDAFTFTKTYNNYTNDQMIIRVRRTRGDNIEDNPDYRYYFQSILQNVTFTRNTKPALDPVGSKIAKTAFKINATKELNGSIQGISAVVQTWCKIWNGSAWVDGATSNPAALMRYVLEHPANPRKITNAASQINLTQLQYFYNYCATRGFEYNGLVGEARGVLEVIRDICAAGRASPALIDGKWTVIIDEPKSNVVQHFTPHNSTGFEGSKALPKRPDGLRVTYYDQDQNYQEAEIIVYDVDKNSTNASLFESITLPGITKKSLVIDHAKWHMAQMKLRPEIYTLTSDVEYLVCNRGDRVKVMHDVPMWGLGSGRIKNRISSTKLELDEDVPMKAGVTYTMRFRSKSGSSVVRSLVPKSTDGYYTEIDLTSSVTINEADVLDLFLFGELNQESQDLMVISIEPSSNNSARLTLVDYGVTSDYNIFTDYLSLSASTVFESQITLPPNLQTDGFGNKIPIITGFVSDESVMERVSKGVFKYNINVAYFNASQLPNTTQYVEVEYDLLSSDIDVNYRSITVPFEKGSANITDVKEGEVYKIRMRYINRNNKVGNWTEYSTHTVVGKINPPSSVTNFIITADKSSGQLLTSWQPNLEPDVYTYEIRTQDNNWGTDDSNRLFYGDITKSFIKYNGSSTVTLFIKAVDTSGNYSLLASSATFTPSVVPNISDIIVSYANSKTTGSLITLSWNDVTTSQFNIDYYEISYDFITKTIKGNSITLPVDWLGDKTFTIKIVDIYNKKSSGYSEIINKERPVAVTGFTVNADKSSGQLLLSWNINPEPDTINYEIRKVDNNWGVDDSNRVFYGSINNLFVKYSGETSVPFYIRAINYYNYYGDTSTLQTFTKEIIPDITNISYSYADTSLTSATITLSWNDVTTSQFNIDYYEISYGSVTQITKSNTVVLPADWLGDKTFTIKSVDIHNKKSLGYSESISKVAPNPPTNFTRQVVDNTVMLYWTLPIRTSLPIDHVLIKRGPSWASPDRDFGEKKGEFTTINENQGGEFTYWIAAVDTEGVESEPISLTTQISEPPDFIFHGEFDSTFTGTKISAAFDGSVLALPVNTTETFSQHFTTRSWNTPQDQITAGYPIFIQPSDTTGYYEEVFDFGQPLASSRVLLTYDGVVVAGSPIVVPKISLSLDNSTYVDYNGVTDIFGLNFRYVKVRITVTSNPVNVGLYEISQLSVRLDAKLKNDASNIICTNGDGTYVQSVNTVTITKASHGLKTDDKVFLTFTTGLTPSGYYTVTAYSTNTFNVNSPISQSTSGNVTLDSLGTIVNFAKEFIDVQSINVSPSGTTPIVPVYDMKDAFASGTYSVTSSVATININSHGMITGQNVKLFTNTGNMISGIYTIISYTTNSFTVAMPTSDTSGNCSMYPQSFRIYLFNNSGVRVTATTSWSIKGY